MQKYKSNVIEAEIFIFRWLTTFSLSHQVTLRKRRHFRWTNISLFYCRIGELSTSSRLFFSIMSKTRQTTTATTNMEQNKEDKFLYISFLYTSWRDHIHVNISLHNLFFIAKQQVYIYKYSPPNLFLCNLQKNRYCEMKFSTFSCEKNISGE